jgi:CheY-like chemotaxis protein
MTRVLVVDDEKILSHSLQRVLTRAGYEVSVANHGAEAIGLLQDGLKPELIFLDLLMPEIGGGEVLDTARKLVPAAKVLMMTAYGDASVIENLIVRGASDVLHKPFDDITKIPELAASLLAGNAKK